jgi:hypothetical protein
VAEIIHAHEELQKWTAANDDLNTAILERELPPLEKAVDRVKALQLEVSGGGVVGYPLRLLLHGWF